MITRIPILIALSVLAGLFWSSGSDVSALVVHFIAPVVIAGFATYFWRSAVWSSQVALIAVFFLLAELVRLVVYGFHGGWPYVLGDSETQLFLGLSFGLQLLIGSVSYLAVRLLMRKHVRGLG
ncbi:MAG TPA: hypothetical protein VFE51_17715 [Verrucomicrobiae bacterium]|nr:hypothetical protein [Verrucomicrobiae bacterium]